MKPVPRFLQDHVQSHASSPRETCLKWFVDAKYGLFIHYGLYSLLGRHEWVQLRERIPVGAYAALASEFRANRFDIPAIVDFAVDCGMRYINLTTRHHDGFCLWPSRHTTFTVGQASPCERDLVGEFAQACDQRGVGLCLYYSHGRDWKHPHAPGNDRFGGMARPEYDPPEPTYAVGSGHDLRYYTDFVRDQIEELLTTYQPIAAIWLDGIAVPLSPKDEQGQVIQNYDPREHGDPFACQDLYDLIHDLQPHTLVSYKQGYLGTEDFFAPEHHAYNRFGESFFERPGEICTTAGGGWGYTAGAPCFSPDELWERLVNARQNHCNLLMNVGPLPDGSLPDAARDNLLATGRRLQACGFPDTPDTPDAFDGSEPQRLEPQSSVCSPSAT